MSDGRRRRSIKIYLELTVTLNVKLFPSMNETNTEFLSSFRK